MKKQLSLTLIATISLTLITLGGCILNPATSTKPTNSNQKTNVNAVTVNTNNSAPINSNTTLETTPTINTTTNSTTDPTTTDTTAVTVTPVKDEGVTWLATPEKLADLNLFKSEIASTITYYKIADLAAGGELIYTIEAEMGTRIARFQKNTAGQYALLSQHSDYAADTIVNTFNDTVTVDDTTVYASLDYTDTVTVNDVALTQVWPPFTFNELFSIPAYEGDTDMYATPDDRTSVVLFAETALGPMYTVTEDIETDELNGTIQLKKYVLKLADTSTVIYIDAKDFLADDGTVMSTFNKGGTNFAGRSFFKGIVANGCGFPNNGDQIVTDMTAERLIAIGLTPSESTLYTMSDNDDPLLALAYNTYMLGRQDDATAVSFAAFTAAQPLLLWQDATGAFVVFMDQTYAPNVECGKPVVYLYPTEPTTVTVAVSADVTVSEPNYGTGWTVTAQPNGQLTTTDGTVYPNLFWEGKGHGAYPEIKRGRVVKSANVANELRQDLTALGLNAQEQADFLAFWLPKMPTSNYVRLTWLGTHEMNILAPLTISPKPDSTIRVFLDFAGQDTAETNLLPQTLGHLPRHGFTVVEWGGALVGGK